MHALVAGMVSMQSLRRPRKIAGVAKVHVASSPRSSTSSPKPSRRSPRADGEHDAFLAPPPTTGKNIAPRVAALLDVMQISDIFSVEGPDTFTRPIYAGNAIATVQVEGRQEGHHGPHHGVRQGRARGRLGTVEKVDAGGDAGNSQFVSLDASKSERPELTSAKVIVSGGRAFGSSEQFHALLDPLADKLGAAVGASRAAVDAGYAPNDYQVGQTGKIVAPRSLYRDRHFRARSSTSPGMKDSEDHRRHQQGRGSADLPGRRHRPRRRPVQDRPGADREALKPAEELGDVGAECVDRIAAFHHDQRWQAERRDAPRHRRIVAGLELEVADRVGLMGVGAVADDQQLGPRFSIQSIA